MTYPSPLVVQYISRYLVPYQASMGDPATWPYFRANHIIWTPSAGLADHRGSIHHLAVGFAPPSDFLATLQIGRARCLLAWMRYADAARELEPVAAGDTALAAEALFWLAAAYYFEKRDTTRMYATWEQLVARYPDSPWAGHTYPAP